VVHPSLFDRLNTWRKVNHWRFAGALFAVLLLLTFTGTALAGAISPDIRQALFLRGFWPRAFPAERDGEALIVIANFYYSDNLTNTEAHEEIRRAIEQVRDEVEFANLRVKVAPICLRADNRAGAVTLAERYNASLVIWGADTGVRVSVNFYNHKQPDFPGGDVRLEENIRTQLAAPSEYAIFITQDLPDQLAFLSFFAVGQSYYAAEDYPASALIIEAAVSQLGDSTFVTEVTDAYFRLGWLYHEMGDDFLAQTNYTRALELDPMNAGVHNNRGIIYHQMGRYEEALADFNRSLELDSDSAGAYNNRGNLYRAMGEYEEALADFNRALELKPEDAGAYNNRGNLYRAIGEDAKALADFDHVLMLEPENAGAYNNRGNLYRAMGEYEKALADFNRALDLNTDYTGAYMNRGSLYRAMQEYARALEDDSRAIEIEPDNAGAHNNRGLTHQALGEYENALADLTRALELDPNNAGAYINRGNVYRDMRDYDSAITDYRMSIEIRPDSSAYYNLALVYTFLSAPANACDSLERAFILDSQYRDSALTNSAFDPIRNEPCFQALMDGTP
jgi:tetratricopeptide (TPR) repeat protein